MDENQQQRSGFGNSLHEKTVAVLTPQLRDSLVRIARFCEVRTGLLQEVASTVSAAHKALLDFEILIGSRAPRSRLQPTHIPPAVRRSAINGRSVTLHSSNKAVARETPARLGSFCNCHAATGHQAMMHSR
jgi:hypothetical protein